MKTEFKTIEIKFAAPESEAKTFSGYGAVFNNVDSYGDVISPGAFTKTLAEHKVAGSLPAMLLNHNFTALPIGVWEAVEEDSVGLKVSGSFLDTTTGNDAYTAAKAGAISGLSIGFCVTGFEMSRDGDCVIRTITEVKLLEVSLVTFPSNDLARVSQVKATNLDPNATTEDALAALGASIAAQTAAFAELSASYAALLATYTVEEVIEVSEEQAEAVEVVTANDDQAKYNEAAVEAVRSLSLKLKQERHG